MSYIKCVHSKLSFLHGFVSYMMLTFFNPGVRGGGGGGGKEMMAGSNAPGAFLVTLTLSLLVLEYMIYINKLT